MKRRLLVVDDDEVFLRPLHRTLELKGYEVLPVQSAEEALDTLKSEDVDLVLTDRRLPGMDGIGLVRQIKADHPDLAIVVMTAYGSIESAVEAMRLGAEDYLVKPFETAEMLLVIRRAMEFQELKAANRRTLRRNQERFTFSNILARSAGMQAIFDLVRSVVDLDTTVLIYGETGVGKELLARSIHFSGSRRDRPFLAVNCAAIPEELFESELFGSRKGAFTGATEHRRGLFQMASGGTLLLDEIGEMPLHLQPKLLRAIEEKKVTSIGADRSVDIDVRFIATTNKDLQAEVERGDIPSRPLLPAVGHADPRSPAPRAARRHRDPGRALSRAGQPAVEEGRTDDRARERPGAPSLSVARQREGAGKRHRAGRHRLGGRHARRHRAVPRPGRCAGGGGPHAPVP